MEIETIYDAVVKHEQLLLRELRLPQLSAPIESLEA
jgi:hypothetical protein